MFYEIAKYSLDSVHERKAASSQNPDWGATAAALIFQAFHSPDGAPHLANDANSSPNWTDTRALGLCEM